MPKEISAFSPKDIGKAIQKARKAKKLSQKALAEKLNKSDRTIQKYEAGEINISISTVKAIAIELDIPWQELLGLNTSTAILTNTNEPKHNYRFDTLGDVINALFRITSISDLSFGLSYTKPPEDKEWTSSLTLNGKADAKYNTDFCLFMENWMNKLEQVKNQKISVDEFNDWQKEIIAYYSDSYFSNAISQLAKEKNSEKSSNKKSSKMLEIISTDLDD